MTQSAEELIRQSRALRVRAIDVATEFHTAMQDFTAAMARAMPAKERRDFEAVVRKYNADAEVTLRALRLQGPDGGKTTRGIRR